MGSRQSILVARGGQADVSLFEVSSGYKRVHQNATFESKIGSNMYLICKMIIYWSLSTLLEDDDRSSYYMWLEEALKWESNNSR